MNESALKVILELGPKYGVDLWKHVQYQGRSGKWFDCDDSLDVSLTDDCEYRAKPRTHIVNGTECPAPMSQKPMIGEDYCYINIADPEIAVFYLWAGHPYDDYRFNIGIFHTPEDATANFYAHYPHMRPEAE